MRFRVLFLPVTIFFLFLHLLPKVAYGQSWKIIPNADSVQANHYFSRGDLLNSQAEYDSAVYYYQKASKLYKKIAAQQNEVENWGKYVKCYNNIGDIQRKKGDYENAKINVNTALEIGRKKLGQNHATIARSYHILGIIFRKERKHDQALKYYRRALAMRRELYGENHDTVAASFNSLGTFYWEKGDYDEALKYFEKAVKTKRQLHGDNHRHVAIGYNNISTIYRIKGDYDRAIKFIKRALAISIHLHGETHPTIATSYQGIGAIYYMQGRYIKAIEMHKKALAIRLEIFGEKHGEVAKCYIHISIACERKGDYDQALVYLKKAFDLDCELLGENHPDVAYSYHNFGIIYFGKAEYQKAIYFYNKALTIWRKSYGDHHPNVAFTYRDIGRALCAKNAFREGLSYYQCALRSLVPNFQDSSIYSNPPLRNILSKVELLNALEVKAAAFGNLYSSQSGKIEDLEMAFKTYHLIANLLDQMRIKYQANRSKLFWATQATEIYDRAIQTTIQLYESTEENAYKEQAFWFAEKNKSTILLDGVQELKAKDFAGIPDSLLKKEKLLLNDLAYCETQIQKEQAKPTEQQDTQKFIELENNNFELNNKYQRLISQFEQTYPKYFQLKYQTQTALATDLQKILDNNATLLEYSLGDSSLTVFAVSNDKLDIVSVTIDSTFFKSISQFHNLVQNKELIQKENKQKFLKHSALLYQALIKPIENHIASKDKLIIISDFSLLKIPFEALIDSPAATEDFTQLNYLIRNFEISYHYSATLFLNSHDPKNTSKPANNRLVAFAPIFREQNNQIASANKSKFNFPSFMQVLASLARDGENFDELPFSENEVQGIIKSFKKNDKEAAGYFHQQASEENFKNGVKNAQYVHVASHSFANEEKPGLSGIAFSQPTDSTSIEDGILYSGEIYNLELNAELVVLSSCESGIGKLVKGEGMLAITRGFLFAGAQNILFSLWKVADKPTSELMIEFYKQLLSGMNYSRALRAAKLKFILKNELTALPWKWSGFVLVGR